jgi:selenide,water dikinase
LPVPEMRALADSMTSLNALASRAALEVESRCATDITGFGLLGHASHIAKASNVTLRIRVGQVPILPGAREAADRGVRTGGADRNLTYLQPRVNWGAAAETDRILMIDPQTSGGLLVCMHPSNAARYLSRVPGSVEIGEVVAAGEFGLELA